MTFTFTDLLAETKGNRSDSYTPVTSAEQYVAYLKTMHVVEDFTIPETVIITFGRNHLSHILTKYDHTTVPCMSHLYIIDEGKLGVLGGFGMGAPAMVHRIEELIAFGAKRFILSGLAGSLTEEFAIGDAVLCTHALSEDGVGHLYMGQNQKFSVASSDLVSAWSLFTQSKEMHDTFQHVASWSFPVIFRETKEDIERVTKLGCRTVEMEVGALYAIAQEKHVEALALFVISDSLANGVWHPQLKHDHVREKLKALTELTIEFSRTGC